MTVIPKTFIETVQELVDDFESNKAHFLSANYSESQARIDFIDKLFEALGWSIRLQAGENPADRDVQVERGQTRGRPDYNFRIDKRTKFFVEAKAPHVPISRSDVILQAKKYAWNNTDEIVYFAVVTDFQEFRFYEASRKPDPKHPDSGLIFSYTYDQYTTSQALANLWQLSRESVAAGSLDKLISSSARTARAKTPLDKQFLNDLTDWRKKLAKSVYKADPSFSAPDLNNVVQIFIDRLIFIRIAEDRGALPPNRLQEIARVWREEEKRRPITADLIPLFREVNEDLNGEFFKPHPCEHVKWDSALVAEIVDDLEPYNFAQIGVELLGSIYERYLGKTIKVTATRADVEDKPEVRKAGGVYYTPKYVVDYIIQKTVGELVKGKSPEQIAKIRIIDPACGSGSFLLGAYQYLLDYHLQWYQDHLKSKKTNGQTEFILDDDVTKRKLSILEKAKILKNNIFGVDLDPQAVEITMMSLYIKMLEGERGLPHKKSLLPSLSTNIKWGNSLIGSDIRRQQKLFGEEDDIHFFDWESDRAGFGKVMRAGGFDAVIGNPPYIQLSMMDYYDESVNEYISRRYASTGRLNTFGLFISRANKSILRDKGLLSFIVPNTLLTQEYYQELRQEMLACNLKNITIYAHPVFADAVVETVVFVLQKSSVKNNKVEIVKFDNRLMTSTRQELPQSTYLNTHKNAFLIGVDKPLLDFRTKLEKGKDRLKSLVNINQAIALKYDRSQSLFPSKKANNYKPVLDGRNIQRYSLEWPGLYLAYDVNKIHSCKRTDIFEADEKIFFRRVGDRLIATYDDRHYYALNTLVVITPKDIKGMSLKYLLGLINSRLLNFYYVTYLKSTKKVFSEIQARQLAEIPIRPINFSNLKEKSIHDQIVQLVEILLQLNKQFISASSQMKESRLKNEIMSTDEQIDKLVYELYGLSNDEMNWIEKDKNG